MTLNILGLHYSVNNTLLMCHHMTLVQNTFYLYINYCYSHWNVSECIHTLIPVFCVCVYINSTGILLWHLSGLDTQLKTQKRHEVIKILSKNCNILLKAAPCQRKPGEMFLVKCQSKFSPTSTKKLSICNAVQSGVWWPGYQGIRVLLRCSAFTSLTYSWSTHRTVRTVIPLINLQVFFKHGWESDSKTTITHVCVCGVCQEKLVFIPEALLLLSRSCASVSLCGENTEATGSFGYDREVGGASLRYSAHKTHPCVWAVQRHKTHFTHI